MSKELEALISIYLWSEDYDLGVYRFEEEYNIIKTALQRLEAIDNAKPGEVFEWIDKNIDWRCKKIEELKNRDEGIADIYDNENKMLVAIKQALLKTQDQEKENAKYKRVLNIIKEKCVSMWHLMKSKTVEDYNFYLVIEDVEETKIFELTQEEFSLLKEVF